MDNQKKRIPIQVYILGAVSFFNDMASEMLYPIIPIFITEILHAPVAVVGLIDGVAAGVSSFLQSIFGYLSDKFGKRKVFVVGGYATSGLSKLIIALSYTWPVVFIGRVADKFGKGLRTGARDAMLLESTDENNKGLVFGIHRTLDSAGAVVGPIIALILLQAFDQNIRLILYVATIPTLISIILFIFVKESKKAVSAKSKHKIIFSLTKSRQFRIFLLGFALFSLGNSSDSFLILRAKDIGISLDLVIVAYIVYNLIYTLFSTPAGKLSDRIGPKKVFIGGIIVFVIVYALFALNTNTYLTFILFGVYGLYIAFTDATSKALVGSLIDKGEAATAYGSMQTVTGLGALAASLIGGLLWTAISPAATFIFGAVCALLSLAVFIKLDLRGHSH